VTDREKIAWLYRRVGFGLAPGQLDELEARGVDAVLDQLVDPAGNGVAAATDPWADVDFSAFEVGGGPANRELIARGIGGWLRAMVVTPRPLEEWMRWFWHGHFVSTLPVVKYPGLLAQQLRTFGELAMGAFPDLVRAATVDPAMLLYLDGVSSQRGAVNENYSRELLELFTLGIGNYTEADVRAGAVALTGWRVVRETGASAFVPDRHDDTPQRYLGVRGVHDVDSVVDAVVSQDACAAFVVGELARAILGPDLDQALLDRLATGFRNDELRVRPLVRAVLEEGLERDRTPVVQPPVPWLVSALKATGADPAMVLPVAGQRLQPAGQLPWFAPNVSGWPSGRAWLGASATVARTNMAVDVAQAAPVDAPAMRAAAAGDLDDLADALGHPEGFSEPTRDALAGLGSGGGNAPAVLAVALASPDLVLA
jgi:uncharacterized protein (DUF1800 family)